MAMSKFGIKRIVFHTLKSGYDRRGVIAQVYLNEDGSYGWYRLQALQLLWGLTMGLSENYGPRPIEQLKDGGYFSEGNECWISPDSYTRTIRISHKYWTDRQVDTFKTMLLSLADCHEWEVEYK